MNSERLIAALRWFGSALGIAAIVSLYDRLVHVNATTVALTFLLFILFLATRWGLRYALAASLAATACYNFFFLPPVHTFTVSDPQNLIALFVLLITSVVSSRMSDRIRTESAASLDRQHELQMLNTLSRDLLQTDQLSVLTNGIPAAVAAACGAPATLFYLLAGDRIYRFGHWPTTPAPAELRAFAEAPGPSATRVPAECILPLRSGVRPRGLLLLRGVSLSLPTLEAMAGLVSISLDRAGAVEDVTRAEAAKESERLRTMMMDSITHEIRSPLAAIRTSLGALRSRKPDDEENDGLLHAIEEETNRLDRLVARSVEMSRLDALEVSMNFTPQSMGEMIDDAVRACSAQLADHPLRITLAERLPRVRADAVWITKLIVNLLENAATYSAAGAPVFISAEGAGDEVACSVADRGEGIEPLEQSFLFDRFYRGRNHRGRAPGMGMGLSLSKAIVQAHGGTISVTSQPGQGSVFTFTLPRATA